MTSNYETKPKATVKAFKVTACTDAQALKLDEFLRENGLGEYSATLEPGMLGVYPDNIYAIKGEWLVFITGFDGAPSVTVMGDAQFKALFKKVKVVSDD